MPSNFASTRGFGEGAWVINTCRKQSVRRISSKAKKFRYCLRFGLILSEKQSTSNSSCMQSEPDAPARFEHHIQSKERKYISSRKRGLFSQSKLCLEIMCIRKIRKIIALCEPTMRRVTHSLLFPDVVSKRRANVARSQ